MFITYHSNKLELFMRLVINIMSNHFLSNPMKPEIILVESKFTEKWIEIELSNYFGISANIVFMSIKSFIQKMSQDMLPPELHIHDFSYNSMYWKFMNIFSELYLNDDCSVIQKYLLNDINQRKCGQLSEMVANLFLQYLIYRSDWLNTWKNNKAINSLKNTEHQLWQSKIWRKFLTCNIHHVFKEHNPLDYYIFLLQNNDKQLNYDDLPERIFIYSFASIPPLYWKILTLLSYRTDVYVWFMNSAINNWHYYVNKNNHSTQTQGTLYDNGRWKPIEFIKKQYDFPLVNLWNDFNQDTLCLLTQLDNFFSIKAFVIPKTHSMLHLLQKDLLKYQLTNNVLNLKLGVFDFKNIAISRKRYVINSQDQSITIHQCHHIQREIEVLHDNLLLMLSNDSSLLPGDIIVMAPNIYDYKSAIKNTFDNIFGRRLPFAISSSYKYTSSIVSSILKILDFWCSRFTSEEVLSFLSVSAIITKFDLNRKEIDLIRMWVTESGVRWGLDQDTMRIFDMPVTDQNTWLFGLKRMLLGYAMNNHNKLWEGIYPYNYSNEEYTHIISKLVNFFNVLKKWRDRLICSYTLKEWMPCFQEIIDDFFDSTRLSKEENQILFLLKTYWTNILESGIQSGYSKKIGIVVLLDQLKFKLNKKKMDCQFLPNVINFCDITPTCCVPCKVLCIIGMNNNIFPRQSTLCDFNLILKEKRSGDNNIRKKDCYTFLLTCLLPKDRLYISFINKINYPDNNIEHTSILIDELLEYFAKNFYLIGDQNLNITDNTKRLRKYLFHQYSCTPFDFNNFIVNKTKIQSFSKEWLLAAKVSNTNINCLMDCNNFSELLPEITSTVILFQDLYNFYRHPVRMWFQKRLGVYFHLNSHTQLNNDEPFVMHDITRFKLNTKLINYMIQNRNIDELYKEYYASGIIPYGSFGKIYWCNQCDQMNKLVNQIRIYHTNDVYKLNINLRFNTIRLTGNLNSIQKNGIIRWKAASLNMKDCFLLWLEHLIYCSSGGTGDSRLFGTNDTWHFPNFSKVIAQKLLFILIDGYCQGINIPLILLYRSGGAWINYVFDWNSKTICSDKIRLKIARQKLMYSWKGYGSADHSKGECNDPYLRKLISLNLNEKDVQKIIDISKNYFLNVMKYRL